MTTYELSELIRLKMLNWEGLKNSVKDDKVQDKMTTILYDMSDLLELVHEIEEERTII